MSDILQTKEIYQGGGKMKLGVKTGVYGVLIVDPNVDPAATATLFMDAGSVTLKMWEIQSCFPLCQGIEAVTVATIADFSLAIR